MKRSASYGGSRKRMRASYGKVVKDVTHAPRALTIKGKKAVRVKKVKKIKVSKSLRAKITKVIDKVDSVRGNVTDHYIGGRMFAASRQQNVFKDAGCNSFTPWLFTLPYFQDVVSQLWNAKAPCVPGTSGQTKFQISTAGNFSSKDLKFKIKNSYSLYCFKNGTQHTVNIVLCVCVPKFKGVTLEWAPTTLQGQDLGGGVVAEQTAFLGGSAVWENGLAQDYALGWNRQGYSPTGQGLNGVTALQNPNISDLFRSPSHCRTLANHFKVEEIKIRLLPGQSVEHKIQGPQELEVDFAKQYKNNLFQSVQRFSRNVFAIVYNDSNHIAKNGGVLGFTNAVPGRFSDQVDKESAGFAITAERSDYCSVMMPEQAGFTFTATTTAGTQQPLNNRVAHTRMTIYDKPAFDTTAEEVIDLAVMNPVTNVNAGTGGT